MRSILCLLLFFVSCQFAFADQAQVRLYKIEKGGGVAYLLGTIHAGVNFSTLSKNIGLKFSESSSLIVEVDMLAAAPLIEATFNLGEDNSLKDQLTSQEWGRFYSGLAPIYGDRSHLLNRLHPALANLHYAMSTLPPTTEPIDMTLIEMARSESKETFYLDSPEVQLTALLKTQTIEALKKALSVSIEELRKQTDRFIQLYVSGDLQTLNQEMHNEMSPNDHHYILEVRNLSWVSQFGELFARPGKEFFAVGAGHLYGEFGLIPLLRKKGYLVSVEE